LTTPTVKGSRTICIASQRAYLRRTKGCDDRSFVFLRDD
jgi:hypothetical protein